MKVLTINTYAGSLLLGASAFGAELVGSYEDVGFGQGIAFANFPDIPHIQRWADWPKQNLKGVTVLAHPPCSAFSVQNSSWNARGVDSNAFACTKRVLDYALARNVDAVAIESVVGALGGAWYVHQAYAAQYPYNIYRVLQNGSMFSVPQWRDRFWVVYVRKDLAPPTMRWTLSPRWTKVKDVITGYEDGPSPGNLEELLQSLRARLLDPELVPEVLTAEQMDRLFLPQDPHHKTCGIAKVMRTEFFPDDLIEDIQRLYLGNSFSSGQMCFLDPESLAGTLLGSTWWYCNGRNLSEAGYKRIMGFPHDYIFPESKPNFRRNMRTFLSKGVIPAVAQWILGQIATHIGVEHRQDCTCHAHGKKQYVYDIEPNEIADFRYKRGAWMKAEMPETRHFEE